MKKIFIASIFMSLLFAVSCQDELTTDPIGATTLKQANTTPTLTSVELSVNSSYYLLSNSLNLLAQWDWNGGLVFQNDYVMQDIASDDMEKKWNPDGDQPWMDDINNYTFTSTNGGPNGLWKYDYEGIKRTNIAIGFLTRSDIESVTGITSERKNQLLGEAYFLRSYYYFSLVTNFGDVPLILAPVQTYQEAFTNAIRADKALVWGSIKADLVLAKGLLPNSKYSSTTEKWRVSKGAVIALQAKAALYTQNWAEVITLVNELTPLGYSLNANYFDSFSTEFTDLEVIFAFNHQGGQTPRKGNGICAPLDWGFFAPSTDFLNSFEVNDPRKLYTVNTTNRNVNKMLGSLDGTNKGNDEAPNNKIYMRMADALLWKAEALNETGDYSGAIAIINQIRARARTTVNALGLVPPSGTLLDRANSSDKAVVKGWLISERRAELGFENQRMLDLKRWGIAKAVMTAHGKNFQDRHMLYPIPQSEIDASAGLLIQNPGY
ncbi:RagB/SusD family nutrient uptake outer membrane protein [Flavobacterium sp. GSP27]|uniref:RagB/SusD family nutrient uptake outer membrane protein n=1 Tax=Flavobacterium bomense TaxID=2497483 RepID=A0A432CF48_9FLAO|nr:MULTISPECIES: RagB/SusD family nutrient uptake outer membrane protein [Flavobacterium]RTY87486.1 RagB/SusD family nutrient uptake outer membrane protein [Flavobacterium sp. GSN2]RTY84844.1 RagB/SusD family nutrient uptake outer membrane protein [Flavobacterium sp. ZB4P23]RTZ01427.1 RagB/SusD family nutrient uptake outer membrane protein [Flavobacterium bomense]RTZ06315.1 RagB/SusD family nutrient uptake outer membrane protein [Flavobacterium sp. GSP6]RTZ10567.1 RagB/SusD family nutrient upt